MAAFILAHGGGHGGWCWRRLAPLLRGAGHDVLTPTLTGLGERKHLLSPDVGLKTHIADIVNVLVYEDVADAILVGHSYGGFVVAGAADCAPERVGRLVFLDASIPESGESVVDASPGLNAFIDGDVRRVDGVDLVLWPGPMTQRIYGVGEADWAWMTEKLTPHPARAFREKLIFANPAALASIPRAIINCAATLKLRPEALASRYHAAEKVWEIDAPHDVMITHPGPLADMLLTLA